MKGLAIEPSGKSTVIDHVDEKVLSRIVGAQYGRQESKDGLADVLVHELWKVADLSINAFVTTYAGVVIGGSAVIVPKIDTVATRVLFTSEKEKEILSANQDVALVSRITQLYVKNRTQRNFVWHEPDRWVFNGDTFDSIVVGEADDHGQNGRSSHDVWFFSGAADPFYIKIVEYSLAEVLEGMLVGDDEASQGNPPEYFRRALQHFGRL